MTVLRIDTTENIEFTSRLYRGMDVDDLSFLSRQFLRLIEGRGLTGVWTWDLTGDRYIGSSGYCQVLGVGLQTNRLSCNVLRNLVHPEDRDVMVNCVDGTQDAAGFANTTFRIIRPDGAIRIISARNEVNFLPDGRPIGMAGTILDVTEQETLAQARAIEQRRQRALFKQMQIVTFSNDGNQACTFPPEFFELTGLAPDAIAADPYGAIVREEREYWRGLCLDAQKAGLIHTIRPLLHTAGHNQERFEVFRVPIHDTTGAVVEWSSLMRPYGSRWSLASDPLRKGLEQSLDGHHLRAARALLDWSMIDLAQASGLSLSTVRRLEENVEATVSRSRDRAIMAMRRAGIRFSLTEDGIIAIARA